MRRHAAGTIVAGLVLAAGAARAGEQVMAEFKNARAVTPQVLQHVRDKGVVAEFLDPGGTGLGKSVSYLLWREVLTAISDQAGAGVIVAEAPPGESLVDMIAQDYHEAVQRIAANQQARLALWGAVDPDGDRLLVDTYVTVLTAGRVSDLRLRLGVVDAPREAAHQVEEAASAFEARLARPRFGLATVEVARAELFDRSLVAEGTLLVRARPAADAPQLLRAASGSVLHAVDMEGGWFRVRLPDGRFGYLPAGRQEGSSGTLMALRVPPKWVEADATGVVLRGGPGRDAQALGHRDLRGRFRVLDMRYRSGQGLWYRIALGESGGNGWVAGTAVRPRFSMPAVHLMAGLYRYHAGRFADAAAEFQRFLDSPGVAESPVNRAAVQQLLGASLLPDRLQTTPAWQAFTKAIELTPYDPDVYMVRSVACVGLGRAETALDDVGKALELDPRNARARAFAWSIAEVAEGRAHPLFQALTRLPSQRVRAEELVRRYGIRRPD